MKRWELKWEESLKENLNSNDIYWEKTSFSISSNLKKLRDWEWEKIIQSGQVVDIVLPKRKGGKIRLVAISVDGLPIEIGTISYYDEEMYFEKGIICQLIDKDLNYANGDQRSCLEFDQPILLIDSYSIPQEILKSKMLKIKPRAKGKEASFSYFGCIVILLMFAVIIYYAVK